MMRTRGHVVFLVMTVLMVGTIGVSVVASSVGQKISARRSSAVRLQALWLARSAVSAAVTGKKEVSTPYGIALIEIEKSKDGRRVATARLHGARAQVALAPSGDWLERYDP